MTQSGLSRFQKTKGREMTTEISTNTAPARGLALASFDDAFRFATMVAKSEFAPKDFRGKPESCLLAIQHGSEIGLSPMQSLQNIACINGRPAIWGDAALALCLASPVCDGIHETMEGDGDNMTAVCQTSRKGKDANVVGRFSVADAKKAGLWGKQGPWTQYPKRMLQLRARGFALRDAFPDVLKGLVTAEEAQDYPQAEAAKEPAMIRPQGKPAKPLTKSVKDAGGMTVAHVERFEPQATAVASATPGDMERSRLAVNKAANVAALEKMQSVTEERLRTGFYTPAQAGELLALINGKLDWLSSEPQDNGTDFPHEAAQHEVNA
jgi:hypothetical protein